MPRHNLGAALIGSGVFLAFVGVLATGGLKGRVSPAGDGLRGAIRLSAGPTDSVSPEPTLAPPRDRKPAVAHGQDASMWQALANLRQRPARPIVIRVEADQQEIEVDWASP